MNVKNAENEKYFLDVSDMSVKRYAREGRFAPTDSLMQAALLERERSRMKKPDLPDIMAAGFGLTDALAWWNAMMRDPKRPTAYWWEKLKSDQKDASQQPQGPNPRYFSGLH